MEDKKDGQEKGLNIDGDVGYSDVHQQFDDHSHHQSTTVNDSSIHDSSTHNKTTVHDQSTRQFSTKTVTQNDSSVTDHSSHVKTENVFMGDRHNPLVYILPIVLVALAAIGAIVLVVNKQQDKPDVLINAMLKPAEPATTPSPVPSQPAEPSAIEQTKESVTTSKPSPTPAKEQQPVDVLPTHPLPQVKPPVTEVVVASPVASPEKHTPSITILPINDSQARQGEDFSFSLMTNSVGSACGAGNNIAEFQSEAIAEAKQNAVTMSRNYLRGRYAQIDLKKIGIKNVRVMKTYKRGEKSNGCYQVDILAETQLYSGSLSAHDEQALLDDPIAPLHLRIWTDKKVYRSGEEMHVYVMGNKPFYARIIYHDASGNRVQILPNNFRPNNSFQGGAIYNVPDGNDGFTMEISAPFGKEEITVYASTAPLGSLEKQDIGGIYLVKTSPEQIPMKFRGIKIKKGTPGKQKNISGKNTEEVIAEFFEGRTHLSTRSQ